MWKSWGALDIEFDIVELLVDILEFRFESGRLVVSEQALDVPGHIGNLSDAFTSIWQFRKWDESRWLTVGTSSRAVLIALLTGVGAPVGAHVAGLLTGAQALRRAACVPPRAGRGVGRR